MVVGQGAWDIEKIWNTIFRTRNEMHGSHVQSAISAIGIALWDVVGQKLGVPVYKLMGGRVNEKLRIYTSYRWGDIPRTADAYAKRTRELIAEGATAGKFDPFFEPYDFYLNLEASTKTIHEVAELDPRDSRGREGLRHLRGSTREVQCHDGGADCEATGAVRSVLD
jgi:L-alanine-DL-glutamate epimerase-like enolase superfamily enzyme